MSVEDKVAIGILIFAAYIVGHLVYAILTGRVGW